MPPLQPLFLIRFLFHFLPWLLHLSIANTLLSLLLPISLLSPTSAYNASSVIAASVWKHIQHIFTRVNHADILITGDTLPAGESAIVVSNHVEWSDFYLIQALALRAGMLGRCRWFAKKELKWVPFLGWGLWAMGMPLVSRRWMDDKKEMDRVFDGVVERKWPIWLISFSESTRLTRQKRLQAATHATKTNKPLPNHLLIPRTKGFAASVSHLRKAPHVKAVYDVTVAYAEEQQQPERNEESSAYKQRDETTKAQQPNDKTHVNGADAKPSLSPCTYTFQTPPTFLQSLFVPSISQRWKTLVHVRRFEIKELPREEEELRLWLEERWVEKGELLEKLKGKLDRGEEWDGAKAKAE